MSLTLAVASFPFGVLQEYTWLFQMVVCLDIVAHWLHLHSQLLPGLHASEAGGPTHHKTIDLNANPILHFYYQVGQPPTRARRQFCPGALVQCHGRFIWRPGSLGA